MSFSFVRKLYRWFSVSLPNALPVVQGPFESRLKRDALVLLWFLLFDVVVVDTRLIYDLMAPAFYVRRDFVISSLIQLGGFSYLAGALLGQVLVSRVGGALVLTALAGILLALSDWVFKLFAGRRLPFVRYVPVMMFAAMTGTYVFALEAVPAVLLLLVLAIVYMSLANLSVPIRAGLLAIMSALLYLATAGVPEVLRSLCAGRPPRLHVLLFSLGWALLCLGFEARRLPAEVRGKAWLVPLASAVAIGPLLGELYFQADTSWVWSGLLSFSMFSLLVPGTAFWQIVLTLAMYASAAVMAVLAFVLRAAQARCLEPTDAPAAENAPQITGGHKKERISKPSPCRGTGWKRQSSGGRKRERMRRFLSTVATLCLLTAAMLLPRVALQEMIVPSHILGRWLEVGYLVREGQYEQALNEAAKIDPRRFAPTVSYDVNLALHETGRLLDEVLARPQRSPRLLLDLVRLPNYDYMRRVIDTCIRLGRLNDAEHYAGETIGSLCQPRSDLLMQVALIYMVKDKPELARIYLNNLADDLIYRRRAVRYLNLLNKDPHLSDVEEISQLRTRMLMKDDVEQAIVYQDGAPMASVANMLISTLERAPSNRLALDYLLGTLLLQGDAEGVARNIYRLPAAGYKKMPRRVQEALLVYQTDGGKVVDVAGMEIDPQVQADFHEFLHIVTNFDQIGPDRASQSLQKFVGTYWFHHWFYLRKGVQ
jgi:hypothetical protein